MRWGRIHSHQSSRDHCIKLVDFQIEFLRFVPLIFIHLSEGKKRGETEKLMACLETNLLW